MHIRRICVSVSLLAATLVSAAGWGPHGHAVVAQLAWLELTPEVQAKVAALLDDAPMSTVGSWADAVRPTEEFRWTAPLHYANMPDDATGYDHAVHCPEAGSVVSAIEDFATILGDESGDKQDRAQALMFLIHFVGDLHQPLHAGRAEDRGGNDINVMLYGNERRLHAVWDSGIIEAAEKGIWTEWVDRLGPEIDEMDRLAWTADLNADDWANTAGRWVYESNRLALEYAYSQADGAEFGDEYVEWTTPVIEMRLSQGGVRLGALLNEVLGGE